jgi:predicted alpha/beta hydrolase
MITRCVAAPLLWLVCWFATVLGNDWPVPRPLSGFGSNGPHQVAADSFPSPQWRGKNVYVFHPADAAGKLPVILFCPDLGASAPAGYIPLINNIVSRGCVLVFSPCKSVGADLSQKKKYRILMDGFETAVIRYASRIDSSRIGIIGHSYGAGAVPAIAWHSLVENQWGANGAFLYMMAPWYSYFITQDELEVFPRKTCCVMEIFHDDKINDRRLAIDIFDNIGVSGDCKVFIELFSDSMPGYKLAADHTTAAGPAGNGGTENALDFYGVYKFVDAVADYVFWGNAAAKRMAFDSGNAGQRFMGTWPDKRPVRECTVTRSPDTSPAGPCRYVWENPANPRRGESPTFVPEAARNRSYYARKTFQNYRAYEKEKIRARRARRAMPGDSSLCAIEPIEDGFGSAGPWQTAVDSLPHPLWPGHYVHVFSPKEARGLRPVVFFCHGYSSSNPQYYLPLISHIVSKGYVVVFSPYKMVALDPKEVNKYASIETGIEAAIDNFRDRIDTAEIGFVGHSFGAGAIPAVALWALTDKNWGAASSFMYLMAPWYSYEIDRIKLRLFPQCVKMITEVFADDKVCDHRMAISLFTTIGIPQAEKNYIMLNTDSLGCCKLTADHNTPKGPYDPRSEEDALDYYGIYRIFDALAAYAFDNDAAAKSLAFGHDTHTCFMGTWPNGKPVMPLTATSNPAPDKPQDYYAFPWKSRLNPLSTEIIIDK